MNKREVLSTTTLYLSIIAVAVITYLPTVDNFFISDDFGMLTYVQALHQNPTRILDAPSEFFRLTSYLYFSACVWLFGPNSVAFYWTGIALHALVSLLVYVLVLLATQKRVAAWSAAVFFAAYERHQEAVMWISAANETLVTLFCLLFLILWLRPTSWTRTLAPIVLLAALFSKEQAVSLAPLAIGLSVLNGKSWRVALREASSVLLITAGYIGLWLSYSASNAFVTYHYYALSLHFFPVYARALLRLLSVALPFAIALYILKRESIRDLWSRDRTPLLFFVSIMALSLIPASFLTYQDSLPSRNTYYPSVGTSAIIGLLFFWWHRDLSSRKAGHFAVFFLSTVIFGNVAYVWMKKDPQYIERGEPTRQLIHVLKDIAPRLRSEKSLCIESFPLDPWSGTEAARWFTSVSPAHLIFTNSCEGSSYETVLRWSDAQGLTYVRGNSEVSSIESVTSF